MAVGQMDSKPFARDAVIRVALVFLITVVVAAVLGVGLHSLDLSNLAWLVYALAIAAAGFSLRIRPLAIAVGEGLLLSVWFATNHLWFPATVVGIVSAAAVPPLVLKGLAKQKYMFSLLSASAIFVVLPVLAVLYLLITRGLPALNWEFLTQPPTNIMREGGILPAIVGTLCLVLGTIVFSLPVGVLAAIYLTEYAKPGRFIRIIRLAIVNLAGVPSVVYGLFGLGLFVLLLNFGTSILSGSLTLAILILPVIITTSEEALMTVPQSFREASLALGATRWQTTVRVVLPNAISGIITGLILGVGRAAGETAPILFTVAAFYLRDLPNSVYDQVMALPYHLYVIATQVPNASPTLQWGTALVLLILVLGMNLIAAIIRTKYRRARKW